MKCTPHCPEETLCQPIPHKAQLFCKASAPPPPLFEAKKEKKKFQLSLFYIGAYLTFELGKLNIA